VIAAVFAIAAAAAVTAGCGGGTSNALSLDPVAAAATKTQEAGAARLRFTIALGSPQLHGGKLVRLTGTGAIDGTSGDVTFSMGSKGSAEVISLQQNGDYVLYVQLAALSAKLPGGKRWVELDLSKLGSAAGLDLGKLLSGSQLQPSDLLSMLQANGGKLSNLGPATVDGVATTHYRATIDVAKALQAKGLTSPLLDGLASRLPTVPEDVWIGGDGLVHRIQIAVGLRHGGKPVRMRLQMDMYDYGAHVTIAAPASSDVFDATQLVQQGLAGLPH